MNQSELISAFCTLCSPCLVLGALGWAVVTDICSRTIPNGASGLIALAALSGIAGRALAEGASAASTLSATAAALTAEVCCALVSAAFVAALMVGCGAVLRGDGLRKNMEQMPVGGGDLKLCSALALHLDIGGAAKLLGLSSFLLLAFYGACCLFRRRRPQKHAILPMAPFIAAAVLILLSGDYCMRGQWYLR